MILVLRGHVRQSFETKRLYNLIKLIYLLFPDLQIFIHTWNIFASDLSWRKIQVNAGSVTEPIIYDYFDDLKHLIKHIIIDDDTKIQLIGNVAGKINTSNMPVIAWKNYWYGKYRIINYINTLNVRKNEMVVNFRFDVMANTNNFDEPTIVNFLKNNKKVIFKKNVFFFDREHNGVDNIYVGNINTMYKLMHKFHHDLDKIITDNEDVYHQERLVFRINALLFP
jgi:hypothetical protein